MSTKNTIKSMILLPLAGREEFNHLPNGYFWFKNIILHNGTIVEPMAFDARTKEQVTAVLRKQITWMENGAQTSIMFACLQDFRLCLHCIEKNVTWKAPFEAIQAIKRQGVFVLPEDVFYIANIPINIDEDVYRLA